MDAERLRLRAIGEHVPQLGSFAIAAPAAGLALDREGRDAEVREGVGVAFMLSRGFMYDLAPVKHAFVQLS
jgi:hypothetical protein